VGTTVTITGDSPMPDAEPVEPTEAMSDEGGAPSLNKVSLPQALSQR
jgi:hypothetical protein